jgi:hypothetical protein
VITIVDPRHPGRLHDVVGSTTTASRRTLPRSIAAVRAAAVVVLVVELVAAVGLRHDQHERRLDQASLADIDVRAVDNGTNDAVDSPSSVALVLRNNGGRVVQVLRVRVDRDGYSAQDFDQEIEPAQETTVVMDMEQACPAGQVHGGPTGVLVLLQTDRGRRTWVRVPTADSAFSRNYAFFQQQHCSLQGLGDSLEARLMTAGTSRGRLVLTIALMNVSVLPRSLISARPPVGFRGTVVSPALPVDVPTSHVGVPVQLSLTVDGCRPALIALSNGDSDVVVVEVAGDQDRRQSALYLGDAFVEALSGYAHAVCPS